jgi:tricarballylate dehydrogenase
MTTQFDVIVVGKGNAALCAALSAHENGAKVLMLEAASEEESGGNSRFAGGVMRFAYDSVDDLKRVTELTDDEIANSDFGTNTKEEFFDDLFRLTSFRTDPDLSEILVTQSLDTMAWLGSKGARFVPNFGRQSGMVNASASFSAACRSKFRAAARDRAVSRRNAKIRHRNFLRYARVPNLRRRAPGRASPAKGKPLELHSNAVVPRAAASRPTRMCTRYLGLDGSSPRCVVSVSIWATDSRWRSRWRRALRQLVGCHATGWDRNAPEFGDVNVGDQFQKHSYIFGLLINANGERFVDEGADFHSFTYAKYGGAVLQQPGQFAWQVFDSKVTKLLRSEYRIKFVTKVSADTLEELATKLEGVNPLAFLDTVRSFNGSIKSKVPFDHTTKDGRGTVGIEPPKSNWAQALDTHRSTPTRRRVASRSRSAAFASSARRARCSMFTFTKSPAFIVRARWSATVLFQLPERNRTYRAWYSAASRAGALAAKSKPSRFRRQVCLNAS